MIIPRVIQELVARMRQSPGIEIGGGGDSIKLNTIPSPANSIAGAFTHPGNQFLNHSGYMDKNPSEILIHEAQKTWIDLNLFKSPWFASLLSGKMDKQHFISTQKAFYHAVSWFSRPMCLLASRIDSTSARMDLIENIYEEHGELDPDSFHENTFKKWLERLQPGSETELPLIPCVDSFNSALMGVCQADPVEKGICCLGIIEYMFSHISKTIAESVVKLKWISHQNLIHYNLHADLDVKHAQDLFEIINKLPNPNTNLCLEGIRLGAFIFSRLFDDLFHYTL